MSAIAIAMLIDLGSFLFIIVTMVIMYRIVSYPNLRNGILVTLIIQKPSTPNRFFGKVLVHKDSSGTAQSSRLCSALSRVLFNIPCQYSLGYWIYALPYKWNPDYTSNPSLYLYRDSSTCMNTNMRPKVARAKRTKRLSFLRGKLQLQPTLLKIDNSAWRRKRGDWGCTLPRGQSK